MNFFERQGKPEQDKKVRRMIWKFRWFALIFFKIEVTQGYALSTDRLPESSLVKVFNPTGSIKKFGTTSHFTIYEVDWGQPYATRFEVWFKPDKGGPEIKILHKHTTLHRV